MNKKHKQGIYERYFKRIIDFFCSFIFLLLFWWIYIIIAILVRVKLGSPILFSQPRPGVIDHQTGKEKIFKVYKFRTMTDETDDEGNLLPDEVRLPKFGAWLRSTSLDELPEIFNILNGTMSLVGPRPQLVRDMVFMTDKQRMRHSVKPGLSGLAQVNGRNAISWDEKLQYDLQYIKKITFIGDMKIIIQTIVKAFIKQEGITEEGNVTAADYGDYLLFNNRISKQEYDMKQLKAKELLKGV